MSIYTRAGDRGKTSLKNGKKVFKSHIRLDAFGSIDELNSSLGVVIANLKNQKLKTELFRIQNDLFEVGGLLAGSSATKNAFLEKRIKDFEDQIDTWSKKLPTLANFILPGGSKSASFIHLSRAICRRAERRVVELSQKEKIDAGITKYLNRLSDLLFTMARFVNKIEGSKEINWTG